MDVRTDTLNEPISGLCFDDLHDEYTWPTEPDFVLYCSCECHQEARAMDDQTEISPAEAQELEAELDSEQGHYVTASLCGKDVRVIPPGAWRMSWQRALRTGDFDTFADKVMHPDDLDLYNELDPTNTEFGEFVADAASRSGEALGKSSGPRPSSKRTRKT